MTRGRGEVLVLAGLLAAFVAAAVYRGGRELETQRSALPSSYNVSPAGTRALFELLGRQRVSASRWERPYSRLDQSHGVLVVVEPLERQPTDEEQSALWSWVQGGGGLLLIVDAEGRSKGRGSVKLDDVEVTQAPVGSAVSRVRPKRVDTALLADVSSLAFQGSTRLRNLNRRGENVVLAGDGRGAGAVYWRYARGGQVLVVSGALSPANRGLGAADNAVLFVNAARELAAPGRAGVLIDEYHQGYGGEGTGERSLWFALGRPVRGAAVFALVLFAVLVYSLNQRFGAPRRLPDVRFRPSTDYVTSMAGLYHRAGAPEIAVETTYRVFIRDVRARLGVPDAPVDALADLGARQMGWDAAVAREAIEAGERVANGGTIAEHEATRVALAIERLRRATGLVPFGS